MNLDLNIARKFALGERHSIQFRLELLNTFNHTNLGVPGINLGAGFGQIVATSTEARVIQFALKYQF